MYKYVLFIVLIFTTNSGYSDTLKISNTHLDNVAFNATHNSYQRKDSPADQITEYGVWECELDFGVLPNSAELLVGHNGPEPNWGLRTLEDWLINIRNASDTMAHPIIIKLEAKTKDRSGIFKGWKWAPEEDWGAWEKRLTDVILGIIGDSLWITQREFKEDYYSKWPTVESLAGKYIISLQDNNDNRDIDTTSDLFFIESIDRLASNLDLGFIVHTQRDFERAIDMGVNRVIMNDGYRSRWAGQLPMILDK